MTRITCFDGIGCIGGNKILLEDSKANVMLDFGLNFNRMGKFYDEFLKPKSCLGLYEPLKIGLLPPIRTLYRNDLVSPRADPWKEMEPHDIERIDGILVSHAHLDHIGSLHYVRADIPIYASAMTLAMAKASQDTGNSGTNDYCYVAPRKNDDGILMSDRKATTVGRPVCLVGEEASPEFADFWGQTPSAKEHQAGQIQTAQHCGDMRVRRYPVDHSLFGASAWALETDAGYVVYTGDIRMHGCQGELTRQFAEEAAELKPRALIIEGTRAGSNRRCTEDEVKNHALEEVRKATGLVVADFGPRNIERLKSFLDIAIETGRTLVLTEKDAYLLHSMNSVGGGANVPSPRESNIRIYNEFQGSRPDRWQRAIRDEYGGRYVTPGEITRHQDKFICCFSYWDISELALLNPAQGSIWIYSSCEPFDEEMKLDFAKLENWLHELGVTLMGGGVNDENSPFHVSGHACLDDLLYIAETIRPEIVIPVHCNSEKNEHQDKSDLETYCEALRERGLNPVLPDAGQPIEL